MNALDHSIIRARPGTPGLPSAKPSGAAALRESAGTGPVDSYRPGPVFDQAFPDLSGLTEFSKTKLLGVRDSKDNSNDARVLLLNKKDGSVSPVDMDWSKTGVARDLEAIAPGGRRGKFLAVEGSSFEEKKARLFELSVDSSGGKAEKSHVLPEFGQEIEGMVSIPRDNGAQTVLFAGRGGEGQSGKIYWGELGENGLHFSPEGLAGQAVSAPRIGAGQRDIADLTADKNGNLWASATVDGGDEGAFTSSVYQLGQLTPGGAAPFTPKLGKSYDVPHVKVEALALQASGTMFVGSDNESFGGRFESIVV